ncbi:uncharacterized protein LOC121877540 isoform X1 [Homarus americanus]|nr:uncharacterized protein LOC121877540 isoform X1 [Homarus americanus]
MLGPPFSRLLRLSPVRNNLTGVLSSLGRLQEDLVPGQRGTEMNIPVSEALDAVVADAASFTPASHQPLQLVVITWSPVHLLTETFRLVLNHAHARYLSAVHVAGVKSLLRRGTLLQEEEEDTFPAGDAAGGVWVTAATYPPDPYTFTGLFKSWLSETKGKDPHIHVKFPAEGDDKNPFTLLFDVEELMVDPVCLPSTIASRLSLHHNLLRTVSTTQGNTIPVVELEVMRRVKCPSLATTIFGQSFYLVPTGATSLSFTDIWENKQCVAAISEQLAAWDEGLLARATGAPGALTPLVAILAAPHCSALSLVHVSPAELLLAERHLDTHHQEVPDKVRREMEQRLESLDVSDLRLVDMATNLIPVLIQHFTKSPRGGGRVAQQNTTIAHVPHQEPTRNARPLPQHPAFMDDDFQPDSHPMGRGQKTGGRRSRSNQGRRFLRAHKINTSGNYY